MARNRRKRKQDKKKGTDDGDRVEEEKGAFAGYQTEGKRKTPVVGTCSPGQVDPTGE
jgi:hypothetical protein